MMKIINRMMTMAVEKVSKFVNLDELGLQDVPAGTRTTVKRQVGELLVTEILRSVEAGVSPVSGRSRFKILNEEYASREKGGNRRPNLELEGEMLDALTFKQKASGIEVGIFNSQAPKADGHNNHSGDSSLPLRRFIPTEGEEFKSDIRLRMKDIINQFSGKQTELENLTSGLINQLIFTREIGGASTVSASEELIRPSLIDELFGGF